MRKAVLFAAIAAAALAAPARAEFEAIGDSGFVTRHTAVVDATPQEAWDRLIEPSGWWSGVHSFSGDAENLTLDPRAGGCFCEMLPVGPGRSVPGSVRHMNVIFVDPGTAMRLSGALGPLQSEAVDGVLTITLKPVEGGTRILFEYVVGGTMRYGVAQIGPAVDRVIGEQLTRLSEAIGRAGAGASPRAIELPASSAAEQTGEPTVEPEAATESEPDHARTRELGADFLNDLDGAAAGGDAKASPQDDGELDEFDTR